MRDEAGRAAVAGMMLGDHGQGRIVKEACGVILIGRKMAVAAGEAPSGDPLREVPCCLGSAAHKLLSFGAAGCR